jgi:hypothetical protein
VAHVPWVLRQVSEASSDAGNAGAADSLVFSPRKQEKTSGKNGEISGLNGLVQATEVGGGEKMSSLYSIGLPSMKYHPVVAICRPWGMGAAVYHRRRHADDTVKSATVQRKHTGENRSGNNLGKKFPLLSIYIHPNHFILFNVPYKNMKPILDVTKNLRHGIDRSKGIKTAPTRSR